MLANHSKACCESICQVLGDSKMPRFSLRTWAPSLPPPKVGKLCDQGFPNSNSILECTVISNKFLWTPGVLWVNKLHLDYLHFTSRPEFSICIYLRLLLGRALHQAFPHQIALFADSFSKITLLVSWVMIPLFWWFKRTHSKWSLNW